MAKDRLELSDLLSLFKQSNLLEQILGVSRSTLRGYVRTGKIPAKRKKQIDYLGRLVKLLLGSWSEDGVLMWFTHAFPIWDKACPLFDESKDPYWQGHFVPIKVFTPDWDPEDPKVKYLYTHVQDNVIGGMT